MLSKFENANLSSSNFGSRMKASTDSNQCQSDRTHEKSLLNNLALKAWGKTLLKLISFFVVLHDECVQILGASNLKFQRTIFLFLDGYLARVLSPGSDEKILYFKNLFRLRRNIEIVSVQVPSLP